MNKEENENKEEKKENILKIESVSSIEFKKQIVESGLIGEGDIGDLNQLINKYKQYKKLIDKIRLKGKRKNNYIIGKLYISDYFVNTDIKIINSFEFNGARYYSIQNIDLWKYKNANEIKKNTRIRINGKSIDFSYYYNFKEKGEYTIEYIFRNTLTKTDYLFSDCKLLTSLDLSNFDSSDVINMTGMFNNCISLKYLNLSYLNTEEVFNMGRMFYGCKSLISLDLSYFNTKNVIDMRDMFNGCSMLTSLNLSNFITKKVNNMSNMFNSCSLLANLNLANFEVKRVNVMWNMFHGCVSLKEKSIRNKSLKLLNEVKNIKFI